MYHAQALAYSNTLRQRERQRTASGRSHENSRRSTRLSEPATHQEYPRRLSDFEVTAMYPVHSPPKANVGLDTMTDERPAGLACDDDDVDTLISTDQETYQDEHFTLTDGDPFADVSPSLVADAEERIAALRYRNRPRPMSLQQLAYSVASLPDAPHPNVALHLVPQLSMWDRVRRVARIGFRKTCEGVVNASQWLSEHTRRVFASAASRIAQR